MTIIDVLAEMCENYLLQNLKSEEQTNGCNDDTTTTEPTDN